MAWDIEVTDTSAGEANYCWVKRFTIPSKEGESRLQVMRRAKAAASLNGVKGETDWYGDGATFRPRGACIIAFVQWVEPEYSFHPADAESAQ